MKNYNLIILSFLLLGDVSCTRNLSSEVQTDVVQANQFKQGQITGRTYHVVSAKGITQWPYHPIHTAFDAIREQYAQPAQWQEVDAAQQALIAQWMGQEDFKHTPEFTAALELNAYLFLDRYLLQEQRASEKAKAAGAYYLRLLFEQAKEPRQWDLLAQCYLVSKSKLEPDERTQIDRYIKANAQSVVAGETDLSSFSTNGRENQQRAAAIALAMIAKH